MLYDISSGAQADATFNTVGLIRRRGRGDHLSHRKEEPSLG